MLLWTSDIQGIKEQIGDLSKVTEQVKELLSWSPAKYTCTKPTACSQKGDKGAEEEAKEAEKAETEGGREGRS